MTNKCAVCGHDKSKHRKRGGSVCWGNQDQPLKRNCKCSKFMRVPKGVLSKDIKKNPDVQW